MTLPRYVDEAPDTVPVPAEACTEVGQRREEERRPMTMLGWLILLGTPAIVALIGVVVVLWGA